LGTQSRGKRKREVVPPKEKTEPNLPQGGEKEGKNLLGKKKGGLPVGEKKKRGGGLF